MLHSKLAHTSTHQLREVIKDIRQQDELLRIEKRRSRVIQQLGTLDGNPDAADLVIAIPELGHLLVETFELLGELLG